MKNFLDMLRATRMLKPLVVCGAARSGTRMATDLLNLHANVAVQPEMHGETMDALLQLMDSVDANFEKHSKRKGQELGKSWQAAKAQLVHAYWASANKRAAIGQGKDLVAHGIKTPGYERFFRQLEKIFTRTPPYAIYCLRSVDKVWRSWASLGYTTEVEVFRKRYERSLRLAAAIRRRSGERFVLFDLDQYVASDDKAAWVARNLYAPLGFEDGDSYREAIEGAMNRNALVRTGTEAVQTEEMAEQMKMLAGLESIRRLRVELGATEIPVGRQGGAES